MMVDGIGGVWAASVLQQGEQSPAHRAREGRPRELRSRGAESRAVAWGGRPARGGAAVIPKHVRLPDPRDSTNSNQMTFEFA